MTQNDIENHMVIEDNRYAIEVSDVTEKIDRAINEAIEKIKAGGALDEIIEGSMREGWLAYYSDEIVSDENTANLINPELDKNDVMSEIVEKVDGIIKQVIERNYFG